MQQTIANHSKKLIKFARFSACLVFVTGFAVLTGWAFNINTLKTVFPGIPAMVPDTALAFIAAGATLFLLTIPPFNHFKRWTGAVALVVILLGTLNLAGFFENTPISFTGILAGALGFRESFYGMAPHTAVNFISIGMALFLIVFGRFGILFQVFSFLVILIALSALAGHLYGIFQLYETTFNAGMALHTAASFLFLGIGTVCSRPEHGLISKLIETRFGMVILKRLLPAIVVIPIILGWLQFKSIEAAFVSVPAGALLNAVLNIAVMFCVTAWCVITVSQIEARRKRKEEELRISEEKYRLLTENAKDVICQISIADGAYEYVSPASLEIFGYPPQKFYESASFMKKIIHPGWLDYFESEMRRAFNGQALTTFEYKIIKKSGEERWIHQSNSLITDAQGRPVAIEGIVLDINERKLVEHKLLESQANYLAIAENANDCILIAVDRDSHVFANRRAEEVTGYSINELLKLGMNGLAHPEDLRILSERMKKRLHDELPPSEYETRLIHKSGREVPIEVTAARTIWNGQPAVLVVMRDITERKNAEAALRNSEAHLKRAQSIAGIGSWEWDIVRNEMAWSDEMYKIFSIQRSDFNGKYESFLELVSPKDREAVDKAVHGSISSGESISFVCQVHRGSRNKAVVALELEVTSDDEGKPVFMAGTVRDITEQKKYEQEILAQKKELNRINDELSYLTIEITNLEEKERKRFAEELHDGIGQNLVAIKMACENCMNSRPLDKKQDNIKREILALLDSTIHQVRQMTSEIFPVTTYEAGFKKSVEWYVGNIMKPKGISMTVEIDEHFEGLDASVKKELFRIVQEALQNILRHSSATKGHVACIYADRCVRIMISDNGNGFISEGIRLRDGSGVGLSLMRERVKALGGSLDIHSAPGQGTRLKIEIVEQ
jgi:PAS domain S-box-containing protein